MSYTDFLAKLENLQYQIQNENTGTAEELSEKLCVSRRTLFYYIELLKDRGYKIEFCKVRIIYFCHMTLFYSHSSSIVMRLYAWGFIYSCFLSLLIRNRAIERVRC